MRRNFEDYLSCFEQDVIVKGMSNGMFGQIMNIPVRPGKLAESEFGRMLGQEFNADAVCAIDYYGHFKKSSSLLNLIRDRTDRSFHTGIVVHFASIRAQHVIKLAPHLVTQFDDFKDQVLRARGFRS